VAATVFTGQRIRTGASLNSGGDTGGLVAEAQRLTAGVIDYLRGAGVVAFVRAPRRSFSRGPMAVRVALGLGLPDCPVRMGYGADVSEELATLKAVVELYERVSCHRIFNAAVAPSSDAKRLSTHRYAHWQLGKSDFPYGEPSGEWWFVRSLATGEGAVVPYELAHYPAKGTKLAGSYSSNGVASHSDHDVALLSSAYELIERDAMLARWYSGATPARIETSCSRLRETLCYFDASGWDAFLANLSLELGPVVAAVGRFRDDDAVVVGFGSAADPNVAAWKAVCELELLTSTYRRGAGPVKAITEIRSVRDHLEFYVGLGRRELLKFFDGRVDTMTVEEMGWGPRTVLEMQACIREAGFEWYVGEHNANAAPSSGLTTYRSFIPGTVPLTVGWQSESLGLDRFDCVARRHKVTGQSRRTSRGYRPHPIG
jgi:thiazole/oxazole-forming peptide maturase SagD family component